MFPINYYLLVLNFGYLFLSFIYMYHLGNISTLIFKLFGDTSINKINLSFGKDKCFTNNVFLYAWIANVLDIFKTK